MNFREYALSYTLQFPPADVIDAINALAELLERVASEEREACAKECERLANSEPHAAGARACVHRIRARGGPR